MNTISKTTPLLQFLIASCQKKPNTTELIYISHFLKTKDLNPNDLSSLAFKHGVYQSIYPYLFEDIIHRDFYKSIYIKNIQKNMLMSAELIHIHTLLSTQNHIDALSFKGPTLAQTAYGNISQRQYGDLDILIRFHDIQRTIVLLKKEGYTSEIQLKESTQKSFFSTVNVIGLVKSSSHIRIEVHWELLSKNYAITWNQAKLWKNQEKVNINNTTIPTLSKEQTLLYLCIHGSKHLFERLAWICDIDRSIRSHIALDWSFLEEEAFRMGTHRMFHLSLALSQHFFQTPLPKELQEVLEQDKHIAILMKQILSLHFSNQIHHKSFSTFKLLLNMRERWQDKVRFIYHAAFAPKLDDYKMIQLPSNFAFLYPLLRPYRLIRKYLIFAK